MPESDSPPPPERKRRERRALSHVGGRIDLSGGDERERKALQSALAVRSEEALTMAHVHGFHSYPARLHPETAAKLIAGLSPASGTVLDPFCGSGTVLVEARLQGRQALGVDANPLAIELAWLKTRGADEEFASQLRSAAKFVAEHAEERRRAKAGPTRRYGPEDLELYDRHVLLELDGVSAGIAKLDNREIRRALRLVLSAALTKLSRRTSDTVQRTEQRRIASGFSIRFFVKKTEDLIRRALEFSSLLPKAAPPVLLEVGDARILRGIEPKSVDLIVTSPPYPGVYDYFDHHAPRLRWLGLSAGSFRAAEIGARRTVRGLSHDRALERWQVEFGACLNRFREVLSPDGRLVLIIADSVLGGRAVRADEVVADLADRAGLRPIARGSQERPHFHLPTQSAFRTGPRQEHVLLLGRASSRRR